ncbi:MAG TPA: DinB family protein [Methylomirabilota bacterium]|nr:DinB family protein [Methylomirabilota bacterium]
MQALQLLKDELKNARETFEGTAADITDEQLSKDPGGKALPLGASYAHLIFSEDVIIHSMLQQKTPLSAVIWKDKTGASEPMPPMDENWSAAHESWAKKVTLNLPKFREYAKAVYAATDEFINSLKDEDLDKEVDLGTWGKKTVAEMLYAFIIGHTNSLAGELSVLKGIQGFTGYPF